MVVAIVLGLFLIVAGYKPEARGLVLGCVFSIVNFILIGETLPLRLGKSKRTAFAISLASICFRFLLMAIPLFVAIKYDRFQVFAVIPGLFMVQMIIVAEHALAALPRKSANRIKGKA